MEEENIEIVETYLSALKRQDISLAPLSAEIVFSDPIVGKGAGAENFRAFLSGFLPALKDIEIIQRVCQGEFVAIRMDMTTDFGLIEIGEFFRVENGEITEIFGYYDPRPILS